LDELALLNVTTATATTQITASPSALLSSMWRRFTGRRPGLASASQHSYVQLSPQTSRRCVGSGDDCGLRAVT